MRTYLKKLELIDEYLKRIREIAKEHKTFKSYMKAWKDRSAVERNLQTTIEAIIDIGKMIISDRKLRTPENNREIFLILNENKFFPEEHLKLIEQMIGLRNIIVHGYDKIDNEVIYGIIKKKTAELEKVKTYFEKLLPEILR
jgi:uncharacterized protein YutE (UPF0331/DUF86 family)